DGSIPLAATVAPSGAEQAVAWSTSDAAIATIGSDGVVRGVAEGTVTITATSAITPAVTATATITVRPAAWVATATYDTGARVSYQGATYVAQWWTKNQQPGATATGPWAKAGDPAACGSAALPAWTDSWIYTGGEKVVHDGRQWQAKWWTRNQIPGDKNGPWQLLSVCPAP
ncbi:MAG TPA: carbohydrate-binding protein, partial [Microbacterium sp.]|nr:carbohydrate-binding protein [Microbacterium sp.]